MSRLTILGGVAAAVLSSQAAFANEPPVVELIAATPFVNDQTTITYVMHDADDDVDGGLTYSLFVYPDENLQSVQDVYTFATRIADQIDVDPAIGTGDFTESPSATTAESYTWGDPGETLRNQGWAPARLFFPGQFHVYLVADDNSNEPVMAVSDFKVEVSRTKTSIDPTTWGSFKSSR